MKTNLKIKSCDYQEVTIGSLPAGSFFLLGDVLHVKIDSKCAGFNFLESTTTNFMDFTVVRFVQHVEIKHRNRTVVLPQTKRED